MYILFSGTFPFDAADIPPPPLDVAALAVLPRAAPSLVLENRCSELPPPPGVVDLSTQRDDEDSVSSPRTGGAQPLHPNVPADEFAALAASQPPLQQLWTALHSPPPRAHTFPDDVWTGVSDVAKSAIDDMLTVDPKHRPSAAAMLRHPWLQPAASPAAPAERAAISVASNSASYIEGVRTLVHSGKRQREVDAAAMGALADSCDVSTFSSRAVSTEGSFKQRSGTESGESSSLEGSSTSKRHSHKAGRFGDGGGAGVLGASVLDTAAVLERANAAADAWSQGPFLSRSKPLPSMAARP